MSPDLYTRLCPKWGSIGELRYRRTTSGHPNPQPNPNAQEDNQPPPYVTLDFRGALARETTLGESDPRPDFNIHEDTPPTTNAALGVRGALPPQDITPGRPNPQPDPDTHEDIPQTPNTTLGLLDALSHNFTYRGVTFAHESVTLETLRAHNPATRTPRASSHVQTPPSHRSTPRGVADGAACRTVTGISRAFDEQDPRMVAARTAQAIAVAVSTSRSYTAVVAAVTAAESFALLSMEDTRYQFPLSSDQFKDRSMLAIEIAINTAVAANTGIPAAPRGWGTLLVRIVVDWALVTVLWWVVKAGAAFIVKYSEQH